MKAICYLCHKIYIHQDNGLEGNSNGDECICCGHDFCRECCDRLEILGCTWGDVEICPCGIFRNPQKYDKHLCYTAEQMEQLIKQETNKINI